MFSSGQSSDTSREIRLRRRLVLRIGYQKHIGSVNGILPEPLEKCTRTWSPEYNKIYFNKIPVPGSR